MERLEHVSFECGNPSLINKLNRKHQWCVGCFLFFFNLQPIAEWKLTIAPSSLHVFTQYIFILIWNGCFGTNKLVLCRSKYNNPGWKQDWRSKRPNVSYTQISFSFMISPHFFLSFSINILRLGFRMKLFWR